MQLTATLADAKIFDTYESAALASSEAEYIDGIDFRAYDGSGIARHNGGYIVTVYHVDAWGEHESYVCQDDT